MKKFLSFILFFLFIFPSISLARDTATAEITWKVFVAPANEREKEQLVIEITLTPSKKVYLYGPESLDGLPTSVAVTASYKNNIKDEAKVVPMPPVPKHQTRFAKNSYSSSNALIYDGPAVFTAYLPIQDQDASLTIHASGLLCSDINCTMYNDEKTFLLTKKAIARLSLYDKRPSKSLTSVSANTANVHNIVVNNTMAMSKDDDSSHVFDYSYLQPQFFQPFLEVEELGNALFFGVIAGLLLNLMPCVLPVISLKFSALIAVSGMTDKKQQAETFKFHCLLFGCGILTWFFMLALTLGLAGWAWGELFQNPLILSLLGMILFLLAMSLFGVFTLPILDLRVSSSANPHIQAFLSGVLATLLATPCSGPLLGGVLGWALLQPLPILILCVTSFGVGMSLPYFILAFQPKLIHLLPRPGNWTLRLEQFLGFFLLASVLYLTTLLPTEWTAGFLMNLLAVAFAAWLWGQVGHLGASTKQRFFARVCAILTVVICVYLGYLSTKTEASWESFDPIKFEALLGKEPIFLDFTADWCPSCKALEHTTLTESRMIKLKNRYGMRLIRVDMTRNNPAGKALLKAIHSSSIPVLALFPVGEEKAKKPLILRDIVTPSQLKDALAKVF